MRVAELSSISELVRASARDYGELPALARSSGGSPGWSYRELESTMVRVAAGLRSRGLSPGGSVVLFIEPGPEWAGTFFGILDTGLVAVPVPMQTSTESLATIITRAGASVVVCSERTRALVHPSSRVDILCVERLLMAAGAGTPEAPEVSRVEGGRGDLAILAFTSGSTRLPRAVELTHDNLLSNLSALLEVRRAGPGDSFLSMLPPAHLFELTAGLLAPLACGARVVYAASLLPNRLIEALRKYDISHALAVPALVDCLYEEVLAELVESHAVEGDISGQDPGTTARRILEDHDDAGRERLRARVRARIGDRFRALMVGGAAVDPAMADVVGAFGIRLEVGYGLTEASPIVSLGCASECPVGSVGRPLPGVDVRVSSDGEILVRGPSVMRGYFGDPQGTAEAMVEGWLRTGDRGRIDAEGYLFITGRIKEAMVTASGETIYPEEVEPCYASPLFREHCVVALSGKHGNDLPTLVVVPASAQATNLELEEVVARLRARLVGRLRIGRMVRRDRELPRTPTGKIRRLQLAREIEAQEAAS